MSAPTPFKRRRLNSSINKPFKSPIRTPLKPTFTGANASPLTSALRTTSLTPSKLSQSTSSPSTISANRANSTVPSTPRTKPELPASPPDPTLTAALHRAALDLRRLESGVLRMRQDIDVLTQALALRRSDRDAELEALTEKWRGAARLAAEELFASARERVHRMGGAGAWREREREARVRWEEDQCSARGGNQVEVEGEGDREEEREGWEYDFNGEAERRENEGDGWDDGDGLTMGTMLKSLGINLEVVGYSTERQTWIG